MTRSTGNARPAGWAALVVLAALLGVGCAANAARTAYRNADQAAQREMWDHAVLNYAKAVALDPTNTRFKVALSRAKLRASTDHFDRGKRYVANGQVELAVDELQQAVLLDPSNQYALVELQKANSEIERRTRGPSDMARAQRDAARQAAELGPPKLDPVSNVPIVLNFPQTTVGEVYEVLSRTSGINFLYDEKLDLKKKTSVDLANITFEKAMDVLMLQNKTFYKVIDAHTIYMAEDSRQKHQELDDNVIRTFYLSNAETKDINTQLRQLLETRRVAENANLNAITLKDTPEKIKVAERIIKANDKARGEVIVDLELLEINQTNLQQLGIDLSSKTLSLTFGDGKQLLPLNGLDRLKSQAAWSIGVIPSVVFSFLKTDSDTKSIARPQLRIGEGETGKITIGDRVPIPATTFNSSQTIGGNVVPITSFTYQNVGIIVEMKPRVHHNKEVTLELKLEVSSLAGNVAGTGGVSQPIIGTRSVETTIRLKDGETNLLAGLIKEDERTSLSGVPGLSDLPFLRRLFGNTQKDVSSTDIVLSITPHIIRTPNIDPIDLVPLWVGTEDKVELRGIARNALGESPFASDMQWDEIQKELDGGTESPAPAAEKTPQVKVGGGGSPAGGAASPPAQEEPPRQPRRGGAKLRPPAGTPPPGTPPPATAPPEGGEPLPPQGDFGAAPQAGQQGDATGGADQPAAEAPPEKAADTPREKPRATSVAQVRLAPMAPQIAVGGTVPVDLVIAGGDAVAQVNFQLRFDPKVVRFAPPAVAGDFFQQGGGTVEVQAVEGGDGGVVVVSVSRVGSGSASGTGTLVRLNFVALAKGQAAFGFGGSGVRGADSNLQPAQFRVAPLEVTP